MTERYIGLMSGTSLDGIDAVLVEFSEQKCGLIASHYHPYSSDIREAIKKVCNEDASLNIALETDHALGELYAEAVNSLLRNSDFSRQEIAAIGNHGQTVRHHVGKKPEYTLQLGDPNRLASLTGIPVVTDFRRKDIAEGGQGAPLVPAFHQALFSSSDENRAIINIGGIANITYLPANNRQPTTGYDSGPGNTLLDNWIEKQLNQPYDAGGNWSRSGQVDEQLLKSCLSDRFFSLKPPKSTGTDYFSLDWLENRLTTLNRILLPENVQATLVELTAKTITGAINSSDHETETLYLCGGGAKNLHLVERIRQLSQKKVATTESLGVSPDWVEAMAFAWLAKQTMEGKPGNLPAVTGARNEVILGAVYKTI